MARRPKIWTALAPATLGATAAFLCAFASPGLAGSGGGAGVIPLTDFGRPQAPPHAPGLGEGLNAPLALRDPIRGPQLAESHAPAAAEGPRFVLTAVAFEGVTVYGRDELRPL